MSATALRTPGGALAVLAGVAATVGVAFSAPALAAAGAGTVGLALGVARGRSRPVDLGGGGLFAGVVAAGLAGAPGIVLVAAATAAAVAWGAADAAVGIGRRRRPESGPAADTATGVVAGVGGPARVAVSRAGATLLVAGVAGGAGLVVSRLAAGRVTGTALVALVVAGAALLVVLGRE